jgi:hypothetical protein
MKINFGLLGLAAAQSGDDRWEDNSYDYDTGADRWSNENQYSLDEANAGITFGVMARVTKQQNAKHFQKALKLSCWNSNMIRDMNNDNKFSVYFNDQVEYKRFQPGHNTDSGSVNGGTVDQTAGADDLSWLYAVGDLRTGYNHQYGFEHSDSVPYYDLSTDDVNRLGHAAVAGKNNNRLRQLDESWADQAFQSVADGNADVGTAGIDRTVTKNKVPDSAGIRVDDEYHSLRPKNKWSHRKWGYQSNNVERAASHGYDANTVVYHFGHHDNKDNDSNRPNMRYAAESDAINESDTTNDTTIRDNINRNKHEFDFYGFKDDWRYSLRMGGCLYEAARWVYDESSFHRTGRLTYTDDTLFMDDPFNPMDGTDIFGAHQYAAHTGIQTSVNGGVNLAQLSTAVVNQQSVAAAGFDRFYNSTCGMSGAGGVAAEAGNTPHGCDADITAMGESYVALNTCFRLTANTATCYNGVGVTLAATTCHTDAAVCKSQYDAFIALRNAVNDDSSGGCLKTSDAVPANCPSTNTYYNSSITDFEPFFNDDLADYMQAKEQEGIAAAALQNAQSTISTNLGSGNIFNANETLLGAGQAWNNAGMTETGATEHAIGDCNGSTSCKYSNVATPSSGGVFADVHWVHVFNAHIFPLQDVGYYQYDQTLGLTNVNENNDSITSRDGYGYNIYKATADSFVVMRDVWGVKGGTTYPDTANNAPLAQSHAVAANIFHNQYGTINIGDTGVPAAYTTGTYTDQGSDFFPILTKTRRKIEDFNVVMANPTYEGHGFLNFVATYHDHTENHDDSSAAWIRQIGKRFLSTIGGLTTASNMQRNVCRALKDGIDSYRMNGIAPYKMGTNTTDGHDSDSAGDGDGHDDPYLGPLGPGPAGNYGNGQRCGAAMYENFGDWFLRPAQTYSAYHNFDALTTTTTATEGWLQGTCDDTNDALCLGGMRSYNYWAFILSEGYQPIDNNAHGSPSADPGATVPHISRHDLWRNGSLHYDRRGADGAVGTPNVSGSSGRGFAISSFPHNELGKDFRFNIRTLHNMGNGVAKQYYQIMNLTDLSGNEYASAGTQPTSMTTLRTSNLRTTETVWSYYFYAVDTIKIAFPEFVARVNHCDRHSHRNSSHCTTEIDGDATNGVRDYLTNTENGNPDTSGASDGINKHSAYPGYSDTHPHRRLGFQDIIIDGVTMKKTDNQYDSRQTRTGDDDWHKQYNFARGLRGDDHTRATLHYSDTEFSNEDASLTETNAAMCGANDATFNMGTPIVFSPIAGAAAATAGATGAFQGYTDSYQPLKPCASWCALDEFAGDVVHGFGVDNSKQTITGSAVSSMNSMVSGDFSEYGGICGRVLRIDGLLQTYDELHNRQYGTIQEIWVQLQYAYQESLDNANRTTATTVCNKFTSGDTTCRDGVRKVQSPFPNVFFSAPEVVDIRGFCPSSNMKCRGYMSDQHQPYGGSRNHVERVHWNGSATRFTDQANAFGANQLKTGGQGTGYGAKQSGSDWTMDRDFRGDSKWPWNYHSYTSADTGGVEYGGGQPGTTYTGRDNNHTPYDLGNQA